MQCFRNGAGLLNIHTNIHCRNLRGVAQEMWSTLLTLFAKYGPAPRLLLQKLLTPADYGTEHADRDLEQRVSDYDHKLRGAIKELWKTDSPSQRGVSSRQQSQGLSDSSFQGPKVQVHRHVAVEDIAVQHIGYLIEEATAEAGLRYAQCLQPRACRRTLSE